MNNRICGKCGSHKVVDAGSYGGSLFLKCETCGQLGMLEKFPEMILFHKITASPEVLAESLVFWEGGWTSRFIKFTTTDREEAIAATVEKLKEAVK